MSKPPLILVDGSGYIFRAYHALPPLTSPEGLPTGAVYGFMSMLLKVLDERTRDGMCVVFDAGRKTFRDALYPAYKANRSEPPEDLIPQFPLTREVCAVLGVPTVELEGYEADDLIATYTRLCEAEGRPVVIIASDKDLMQLIRPGVTMWDPIKGKIITPEMVFERFGVAPEKIPEVQALIGDSIDNIPGVPSIGPKGAAELIQAFGSVEGIYQNLASIEKPARLRALTEHEEGARLSRKLVELDAHVPVPVPVNALHIHPIEPERLWSFMDQYGFRTLKKRAEMLIQSEDKLGPKTVQKPEPRLSSFSSQGLKDHQVVLGLEKEGLYIAVRTEAGAYEGLVTREELEPLLKAQHILKIVYNYKEIAHFLNQTFGPFEDILIMAYDAFGGRLPKTRQAILKELDLEEGYLSLFEAKRLLDQKLTDSHLLAVYAHIDKPLLDILYEMENRGILISPDQLRALGQAFQVRMDKLALEIFKLAGVAFNIGSPKQLADILFNRLGLQPDRKGKSGTFSTDAAVLETLAKEAPIAQFIMDWRALSKLKNTYTDALVEVMDKNHRVHTTFLLTGTATGRVSSADPNLQNIPVRTEDGRAIRTAFIAPPGKKLLSLDYSQIELRLLSSMGPVEALQEAFARGEDIHVATAARVFKVDKVTPELRRAAKAVNFGIIYGMGAHGLATQLEVPLEEAQKIIEAYFELYPGIHAYVERTKRLAETQGYVSTFFGRRCAIPGINDRNPTLRNAAQRQAINAPLQGTAADIIKKAMIKISRWIEEEKQPASLLLQVHDELLFEIPEGREDLIMPLKEKMEQIVSLPVPLVVDARTGPNWGGVV